jgi:carbonic anhydrase/acetyltransferase-like protein (isoleucine patch superfamily)
VAIYQLGDRTPRIAQSAYVAEGATIIGDVTLGERASVWPGAVIRGDNEEIRIGDDANVQDGAVLHADPGFPLVLGDGVSVGHQAMVHGCTIGEYSLVGIHAVVLNGAVIGKCCLVGAGALIPEGREFPERSLILGMPAKAVRPLTEAEVARLHSIARGYVERQAVFKAKLKRIG